MANYLLYLKSFFLIYKLLGINHELINCGHIHGITNRVVLGK